MSFALPLAHAWFVVANPARESARRDGRGARQPAY
jgi:hypothetical protein